MISSRRRRNGSASLSTDNLQTFLVLGGILALLGTLYGVREVLDTGWRNMRRRDKLLLPFYPVIAVLLVVGGTVVGVVGAALAVVGTFFVALYFLIVRPLYFGLKAVANVVRGRSN
jgi:hypothetical protein